VRRAWLDNTGARLTVSADFALLKEECPDSHGARECHASRMKILVLGASGLLGHTVFRILGETSQWSVSGAVRDATTRELFPRALSERIVLCGDLQDQSELARTIAGVEPDVVINCLSVPKGELREDNLRGVISGLSVLPHRIALACAESGTRLVHFSSDGVFSGAKGDYSESDPPDSTDVYGIAKFLGEVRDPHAISIRTSMIGHELRSAHGLLEWFLSQQTSCSCFTRAVFSGLPTTELARIIRDVVLTKPELSGVYHVAARPISKFDLLQLVAEVYGKTIRMDPDDRVVIDRSLNADRFRTATGYEPPTWPELIETMHADHLRAKDHPPVVQERR
jgi:dTDP-4-dehydrorhamnose reductase